MIWIDTLNLRVGVFRLEKVEVLLPPVLRGNPFGIPPVLRGNHMSYQWSDEEYAANHPFVQAVRALLEQCFNAIESGEIEHWHPDTSPRITEVEANHVIEHLDTGYEKELHGWAHSESAGSYTTGPGFARLTLPQRIALCQQLHRLKVSYGSPIPTSSTPPELIS